jgi:hypothetical protein
MGRWLSLLLLSPVALAQMGVQLAWTPSTAPGTTVNIYRASSSCSNPFIKVASGVSAAGPWSQSPLPPGGTFAYQITAVLNGIESTPSNCIVMVIPPIAPPVPPTPTNLNGTIIP